jgi:hypothetical protein
MSGPDDHWEILRDAHRAALLEYLAAAEAIQARLATSLAPTGEQFEAEELARRRLFDVRRRVLALRRGPNA